MVVLRFGAEGEGEGEGADGKGGSACAREEGEAVRGSPACHGGSSRTMGCSRKLRFLVKS